MSEQLPTGDELQIDDDLERLKQEFDENPEDIEEPSTSKFSIKDRLQNTEPHTPLEEMGETPFASDVENSGKKRFMRGIQKFSGLNLSDSDTTALDDMMYGAMEWTYQYFEEQANTNTESDSGKDPSEL